VSFSAKADRSSSQHLDQAQVKGKAYVFLPAPKNVKIRTVEWFLDDPTMQRAPRNVETSKPFDFLGTDSKGSAIAWDTGAVAAGTHRITARWTATNGAKAWTTAVFTVASLTTSSTAAPIPTTTVPPTTPPTTAPAPTTTTPPPTTPPTTPP
jgi:hypothetical protein